MMSQITVTNTLIQTQLILLCAAGLLAIYAMAFFGMQPLGGLLIGFISQYIGVQNTVLIEGVIAMFIGLLHVRFLKKNRMKKHENIPVLVDAEPVEVAVQV